MQCTRTTMRKTRGSKRCCVMLKCQRLLSNYLTPSGKCPYTLISEPIIIVSFEEARSAVIQLMLSSPDF